MHYNPLVSVFIPYYNDEKYLKQAIESVLNQSYSNFELILLNHASTDNSRNIAHSYQDKRIKHIDMEKNYGAGGGILFEAMLNASLGQYIKTFCADDELRPDCLKILVEYMQANPNKDFAFGNVEYINSKGKDLNANFFDKRPRFSLENDELACIRLYARKVSFLPYIGAIVKKEALQNIKIDKTMVMLFDMSLWLSLLCKGYKIGYCNEIIANYRISKDQISSHKNKKNIEKYSFFEHSVFWKIFFEIKDVEFAKRIWGQSLYKQFLNKVEDIPFFIAIETFHKQCPFTYQYLNSELQDPQKRKYYENTFGFGIKELRKLCLYDRHEIIPKTVFGKINKHIYKKNTKELTLIECIYLVLLHIFNIITLQSLIKRFIKKQYSL